MIDFEQLRAELAAAGIRTRAVGSHPQGARIVLGDGTTIDPGGAAWHPDGGDVSPRAADAAAIVAAHVPRVPTRAERIRAQGVHDVGPGVLAALTLLLDDPTDPDARELVRAAAAALRSELAP